MKIFRHFLTITKHRNKVIGYCFRAGVGFQGLFHDLSKYSPEEFFPSAKLYQGNRSPNEKARELYGYSLAWMHHKGRNKHHFEYWRDISPLTKRYEPVPMPDKYIKEMVCDRISASKIYMKEKYTEASALEYLLKGNDKEIMHKDTYEKLVFLLNVLKNYGEEKLFSEMRNNKTIIIKKELLESK